MTKLRVGQLAQSGASTGQTMVWNGTLWVPADLAADHVTFDDTGLAHISHTNVQDALEDLDAAVGAGGYQTVKDEGTSLTARTVIDFQGAGVTAVDDAGNSKTVVTIPGASGITPKVTTPQGTFQRQYTFISTTSSWTANHGTLAATSTGMTFTTSTQFQDCIALEPSGSSNIADGEYYADLVSASGITDTNTSGGWLDFGLIFRATDASNFYQMTIRHQKPGTNYGSIAAGGYELYKCVSGSYTSLDYIQPIGGLRAERPRSFVNGNHNERLMVRFVGSDIWLYLNELEIGHWVDSSLTTGRIGLRVNSQVSGDTVVAKFANATAYTLSSTWTPANY